MAETLATFKQFLSPRSTTTTLLVQLDAWSLPLSEPPLPNTLLPSWIPLLAPPPPLMSNPSHMPDLFPFPFTNTTHRTPRFYPYPFTKVLSLSLPWAIMPLLLVPRSPRLSFRRFIYPLSLFLVHPLLLSHHMHRNSLRVLVLSSSRMEILYFLEGISLLLIKLDASGPPYQHGSLEQSL